MSTRETILELRQRMGRSVIGQEHIIERILIGLLADGHLLVEGLPGLAKTRAVKSLARNLAVEFRRIQFTPDLLPADVTGTEVLDEGVAGTSFRFQEGPIFGNLVLADEINRAPAKVQAALLEAMEERQVTVAGKRHPMPVPFMVMATQNPVEQEGTYPLPEAQMDRFLMHVLVGYPDEAAEIDVVRLVRGEQAAGSAGDAPAAIDPQVVLDARAEIDRVHVAEAVERYIVDLIFATRSPERFSEDLRRWIQVGASPRGSIGLDRCARARAWLVGRDHVTPEDVRDVAPDVLRHRLMLSYEAAAESVSASRIVERILQVVAVA